MRKSVKGVATMPDRFDRACVAIPSPPCMSWPRPTCSRAVMQQKPARWSCLTPSCIRWIGTFTSASPWHHSTGQSIFGRQAGTCSSGRIGRNPEKTAMPPRGTSDLNAVASASAPRYYPHAIQALFWLLHAVLDYDSMCGRWCTARAPV